MVCYVYLKMASIEINQILARRHGLGINFVSDTDQRGTSINCLCIAIAAPLTAVSDRGWKLILMRVVDSDHIYSIAKYCVNSCAAFDSDAKFESKQG